MMGSDDDDDDASGVVLAVRDKLKLIQLALCSRIHTSAAERHGELARSPKKF